MHKNISKKDLKLNILITGGNGFLGSSLAEKYLNEGHNVILLVRSSSNLKRIEKNKTKYLIFSFSSDLELPSILQQSNPDIIINTACSYGRNNESLLEIFDSNYRLGLILLNHIVLKHKPVIFLNIGTIINENVNLYSFSKHQFSQLGKFISFKNKHIIFKNILLQHMYGPGDDESKFTSHVIKTCIRNESILNLTKGDQKRDFIFIKDAVDAIFLISNNIEILNSEDIELGSGHLISIKEFVLKVKEMTNSKTQLNFGSIPYRGDEVEIKEANLEELYKINWRPKYNLIDGLLETFKYEIT